MPLQPVRSDAWLLAALVYGKGDPGETMSAAEGLNRTIPLREEWEHACVVLSERGLLEASTTFLQATPLGTALVERITSRKGVGLFRVADFALRDIERAPITGHPIVLPDVKPFDTAYHRRAKRSSRSREG